ncbi:PKD domain-containing protein [Arthrobacter alpinus]|uniref:PKD domain-containing protein n=1 Tax=Arthrobacter alpinus TaxID=656366 RepID=UPI001EF70463|nr:hypothetical protein [Arthrobacter alpinus]
MEGRDPTVEGNFEPAAPVTDTEDKTQYDYRLACTDGDSLIFDACADLMSSCSSGADSPDGKPGTAIYWYYADTTFSPPVWTFHSGPICVYDTKPRDILAEIAASIAHEFQRSPIVAATIGSQPGPHTLRGKETNVWAEATTQTFNLTMLGQQVTITATPTAYTWNYGDGTIWGPTPSHGAPLHQDRIGERTQTSHIYTETGHLTINLTTHFNGSYTVNNGPQLPIPGQGNIASPPLPLTVWRAKTNLYADNCIQNPQGIGC